MLLAASSVTGCASDDSADTAEAPQTGAKTESFQDINLPLDANAAGSNSTAIVNDLTFSVPSSVLAENASPAALADTLKASQKTAISFSNVSGAKGDFTMTSPTMSGKLKIASCTFTVGTPASLAGTIFIKSCAVKVSATGVPTGGGAASGTATLVLNGVSSDPVAVQIGLEGGAIVVNGHPTKTVVTGTSGG